MQAAIPQNFLKTLADVCDYWSPHVIARVNDQHVKVAELKGQPGISTTASLIIWRQADNVNAAVGECQLGRYYV